MVDHRYVTQTNRMQDWVYWSWA